MNIFSFLISLFFLGVNFSQETFDNLPTQPISAIVETTYHSETSNKELPYYFISQGDKPDGILIYMHGAGGKYEQGMSDTLFEGNFKKLKEILGYKNFLYVTPETSNFEKEGGNELVNLIFQLKKEYGEIPIYLSGASAGGRTIFYAWEEIGKREEVMGKYTNLLSGLIFICPALSEKDIDAIDAKFKNVPTWIEVGEKDTVIPIELAKKFEETLNKKGFKAKLEMIKNGDHNAPVEQINWERALDYIE